MVAQLQPDPEQRGTLLVFGGGRHVHFAFSVAAVVQAWDFFEHGDGAREGVGALR